MVAAMPAGSFVGALAVSQLADRIGRKRTIILSGLIWVIGSILQCAAVVSTALVLVRASMNSLQNRGMLVVGRIISGLSVGIASAVVPVYQSEIAEPRIRGRIVATQQWAITCQFLYLLDLRAR